MTFYPIRFENTEPSIFAVSDDGGLSVLGIGEEVVGQVFQPPTLLPEGITLNHVYGYDVTGFASYMLRQEIVRMSEKIYILSPSLSDRASLFASSALGTLLVTNVQDQEPGNVWRTESAADQYVNMILPRADRIDTVAMTFWQGGFSSAGLWRAKVYNSSADMFNDNDPIIDTDWVSVWPQGYMHNDRDWGPEVAQLRWENDQLLRYVRICFTDPASSKMYLDISRLAVGKRVQFLMNPKHEGGLGYVANDVQEPNGYGQVFTDPRPYQQRQFDLVWSALGDHEMKDDISELTRQQGQAGDFYVFLNPGAVEDFHKLSMQAIFESTHRFTPLPSYVQDKDGTGRMAWSFNSTMIQKL